MNHVFKTVLNRVTGLICVVSEKNKNIHQGQSEVTGESAEQCLFTQHMIKRDIPFKSTAIVRLMGVMLLPLLSSSVFATSLVYDGSQTLTPSAAIAGNFQYLMGPSIQDGILIFDAQNDPILSDGHVDINYVTGKAPGFVTAGYAGLYDQTERKALLQNNRINITQGEIQGNVYSGLAHFTEKIPDLLCTKYNCDLTKNANDTSISTNKNSVLYQRNHAVAQGGQLNTINAGMAGIHLAFSDIVAGDTNYIRAEGIAETKNAQLESSDNVIEITGEKNTIHSSFNAGTVYIEQAFANIRAGSANSTYALAKGIVENNKLISGSNHINLSGGDNQIKGALTAGSTQIRQRIDHLIDGTASDAVARPRTDSSIKLNQLMTEQNHIVISSENNVIEGDVNIGMSAIGHEITSITGQAGKQTTAESNIYNNDLISSKNIIDINARANTIHGDINAGSSTILSSFALGDHDANIKVNGRIRNSNQLVSGDNQINITAADQLIQGGLYAGKVSIGQKFGDMKSEKLIDSDVDSSSLTANNNKINIVADKTTIQGDIFAGSSKIEQHFGTFKDTDTLRIYLNSSKLESKNNNIHINGLDNHIAGDIVAGQAVLAVHGRFQEKAATDLQISSADLNASNNSIDLNGRASINGKIYGGIVGFDIDFDRSVNMQGQHNKATATQNTITIAGHQHIDNKASAIYGGYLLHQSDAGYQLKNYDVFTGNTLNYSNSTPINIGTIGNFQTYNFTLSPELGNSDTALITADHIILGTNKDNISKGTKASDVYVTGIHSGKLLATGTEFVLMQGQLEGEGQGHLQTDVVQQGISLLYDVETKIDQANNRVTATIVSGHKSPDPIDPDPIDPETPDPDVKVNPQLKSLLEGNLAGLMLVSRSGDNIAYNTFQAISKQNQHKGLVPFIQMEGHHARYQSGSHIDANAGLLTAGLSYQNEQLSLAVFSENGWGEYDSHNTFVDAKDVNAKGNNRFNGGGIYGHYHLNNGLYTDVSLRAGRLHNDYKTDDIRHAVTQETANYKVDGHYYGAHVGAGYQFNIDNLNRFDLSLKYLWSSIQAQDINIAGDQIHFDRLNSSRVRLHGENSYKFNKDWSLLLGSGLEYEFDGVASGTTYQQFAIDAPSVKGLTALGTLGLRYQPVRNQRFRFDFIANGYVGKRDGGGANLHLQYAF